MADLRPPREIAHFVRQGDHGPCRITGHWDSCDLQTVAARTGMIEALRWVLPHVWPDMRAEVSAKLAELEKS